MLGKKKSTKSNGSGTPKGSSKKGPDMDGFKTILEPVAVSVKEENIGPFTMAVEAFTFEPQDDMKISHFKNGDKERKIYCNLDLGEDEKENVAKLQEQAKKEGLEFLPSVVIMAGRFLSRARGDPHKAIQLMQATQEWRLDYFKAGPVYDSEVLENLKLGVVYFCGRDFGMRPTLVCRANRIPAEWHNDKKAGTDKLIRTLIFCMEYMIRYMLVPGRIENNCLIVDLKGLGIFGIPMSALHHIYSIMSHHYIGRVFRFYVINMSSTLSAIAGAVKGILTDRQQQKLCLLTDIKELQKDFAPGQLEEDLGGTRKIVTSFYPFPMPGGPYEAGATSGTLQTPTPGVHKVLSEAGIRGRLWDPKLSREENRALHYSPEAYEFFKSNNLPVPPDCQRQHEADQKIREAKEEAEEAARKSAAALSPSDIANNVALEAGNADPEVVEEEEEEEEETEAAEQADVVIQDSSLVSGGFFGCSACYCSQK
ncbi:unnamed protein product [Polarella glacialis]|uniref:CRAL-TRIO domain-containing protein n=1 Tax=Polarella glacialis TaxID=89957 RepID=A0A813E8G5_POLGL|nr:unnamed protein product [Polarella glacialis]